MIYHRPSGDVTVTVYSEVNICSVSNGTCLKPQPPGDVLIDVEVAIALLQSAVEVACQSPYTAMNSTVRWFDGWSESQQAAPIFPLEDRKSTGSPLGGHFWSGYSTSSSTRPSKDRSVGGTYIW